jgi:hypothetical protein
VNNDFLSSVQYRRIWEKLYPCADVGRDSVRRRHGTSMKAQGKKKRLQPFPLGVVGAEPRSGKCYPGYRPPVKSVMVRLCALHPTFGPHSLRSPSAKKTPLLHGRAGRDECVIMVFSLGLVGSRGMGAVLSLPDTVPPGACSTAPLPAP